MTEEEMNLSDVLEQTKNSLIISDAFTKADSIVINSWESNHEMANKAIHDRRTY